MKAQTNTKQLSNIELAVFFRQLHMVLQSGISSYEGISILKEDAACEEARLLLQSMEENLSTGKSLYDSLKESQVFPQYALQMIRIGEYTGTLDQVTESLSHYYYREEAIFKEIQSALTYPIVMIAVMLVIVGILIIKVLPVFNQVYRQLGAQMTGLPRTLLNLGTGLQKVGLPLAGILVIGLVIYFLLLHHRTLSLPTSRQLKEDLSVTRFSSGLSLILGSGLDYEEGLSMLQELTTYKPMKEKIAQCSQSLLEGTEFTEALKTSAIFQGLQARMVSIGIRTGNTAQVMKQVSEQYQERVSLRVNRMISILEPTLVAVLAVLVGMILLSVMFPLLGVLTGMNL